MAFQRYIHKHGRKLGPYYYENVRSPDGRVKTVYVGNSHRHPGHRIRKPLIFLILALLMVLILGSSLFFLQNKSYLVDRIRLQEQDFELDQILLKVLIRSNEILDKQVRVMNTGSEPITISAEVLGLADIVKIDSPSFSLKPGQTKVVGLTFSSFVPEQKIEQQAGVYIGKLAVKSQKASKSIPIIVEIETKNVLFDMNLNPLAVERKLKQGSDAAIEVRLFNLQSVESVNVDVEYFVKDINGNTILTESETVIVKTQASFFKTISVPKSLKPGPYVFAASSKFGNSVGTASYLFEVIGHEEESFGQFCKSSILCLGLSLTTLLLLFSLIAYFYFFIGAYLFEKITGSAIISKNNGKGAKPEYAPSERAAAKPKIGIFGRIRKISSEWAEERQRQKSRELEEKKELKRQDGLERLREEAERKKKLEMLRKENEAEEKKKLDENKRQEQAEAGRREEKKAEKERARAARKKKINDLLHRLGFYKTPEEKHEERLKKKKEAESRQKEEEMLKKKKAQERLDEEKKILIEKQKKEAEEKKRDWEKEKKQEEILRQKELEEKREHTEKLRKELEIKKRWEELQRRRDFEARKKEEERQRHEAENRRKEHERARRLERISRINSKLAGNAVVSESLKSEFTRLDAEKKELSGRISESSSRIRSIDGEIKSLHEKRSVLRLDKKSLNDDYEKGLEELAKRQEVEKLSIKSRMAELKSKLAGKRAAMEKEIENELSGLSPEKRKSLERLKRMELSVKLRIEEQIARDNLENSESHEIEEKKRLESSFRESLRELNKRQRHLSQLVSGLENEKQRMIIEEGDARVKIKSGEDMTQGITLRLGNIEKENKQLKNELSELNHLPLLGFSLFRRLIPAKRKNAETEVINNVPEKKVKHFVGSHHMPGKVISQRGREFYNQINAAKEALDKKDISDAKRMYVKARNIYIKLGAEEKKRSYRELASFYNKLTK